LHNKSFFGVRLQASGGRKKLIVKFLSLAFNL
jgi:hypothetical protein